jgi:hypothetical protein
MKGSRSVVCKYLYLSKRHIFQILGSRAVEFVFQVLTAVGLQLNFLDSGKNNFIIWEVLMCMEGLYKR